MTLLPELLRGQENHAANMDSGVKLRMQKDHVVVSANSLYKFDNRRSNEGSLWPF
jgi:hypothetical protein